jgi:hypothetical protein
MKTGRRRLLNAALTKRLCEILEKGNTVRTATAACGIAESTYFSWIQRGEAGEPEFMEFSQACASAKATAKQMLTDIIVAAAPRDPKMACWLLEKLYPGEYGDGAHPDQPPEPPLLPPLPA